MAEKDTKTKILDAAQDLIQRLGANGISYQHISDAVGIRKASIHHHFPTKEDLIEALLERYNNYFLGLVDDVFARPIGAKKKLTKYVELFEATLNTEKCDKACLCGVLGAEIATLGLESGLKIKSFYEGNEKRLAAVLEEGKRTGEFRFKGDTNAAAALVFALLEGTALIARAHGGVKQFRRIVGQLHDLLEG